MDITNAAASLRYEPHIVAFIDILGFSKLVEQSESQAVDAIERINRGLGQVEMEAREHRHWGLEFSYRMFSDCICLSSEFSNRGLAAVTESAGIVALMCTSLGLFMRGGIAAGRHYESEVMLFSEALVRAYRLESVDADNPRILLAPDLVDGRMSSFSVPLHVRDDEDGARYVDYLESCSRQESLPKESHPWALHRKHVIEGLRNSLEPRVHAKYVWLADYHNKKVDEVCERDGERENGVNHMLKIPREELTQ